MTTLAPSALIRVERLTPEQVLEQLYKRLKPTTVEAYARDLKSFALFLGVSERDAIGSFLACDRGQANSLAQAWDNAMLESGLSSATRARRLSTLNVVARAARTVGLIDWTLDVARPKVRTYRDTRGPASDVVDRLFAACGESLAGRRDRFLLSLLYVLGLRRFEAAGVRASDYRIEDQRLYLIGKGDREQTFIDLSDEQARAFNEWIVRLHEALSTRGKRVDHLVVALDRGAFGEPLSLSGVDYVVDRIGKRAGVKVWPHALRHSAITTALDSNNGNVVEARGFSRHTSVDTLMRYDDNRLKRGIDVQRGLARRVLK